MVYDCLMRCSWETLRTFAGNQRQLYGTLGTITVLYALHGDSTTNLKAVAKVNTQWHLSCMVHNIEMLVNSGGRP